MTTKAMAIQSGKMLKGNLKINIVFYMLKVTKMTSIKLCLFLITKVFVTVFVSEMVPLMALCCCKSLTNLFFLSTSTKP